MEKTIKTFDVQSVERSIGNVVYAFVLIAPPVPLEVLEGTLEQQKGLLAE